MKQKNNYDSLFSVTKVQKRFWSDKTKPVNHSLLDEPTTQNLVSLYEENSCIYIFSRKVFEKNFSRVGNNPKLYPISSLESIDIDEPIDFEIAEFLMQRKLNV